MYMHYVCNNGTSTHVLLKSNLTYFIVTHVRGHADKFSQLFDLSFATFSLSEILKHCYDNSFLTITFAA